MVGWWVIPAASRAAGASLSQSGHFLLSGALGGFFLGSAEGMMEESTLKTIRGGFAGVLGGIVGSLIAISGDCKRWGNFVDGISARDCHLGVRRAARLV